MRAQSTCIYTAHETMHATIVLTDVATLVYLCIARFTAALRYQPALAELDLLAVPPV